MYDKSTISSGTIIIIIFIGQKKTIGQHWLSKRDYVLVFGSRHKKSFPKNRVWWSFKEKKKNNEEVFLHTFYYFSKCFLVDPYNLDKEKLTLF